MGSPAAEPTGSFAADIRSKHETVFSIFLLVLAFLFRDHPSIAYPELLYVFFAFLGFNFLYNRFLKQRAQASHLAYSPVFINGILITWALRCSGGESSYLWVMYLLPVFTACLLFDGRGVVLSTLYVGLLQLSVYGQGLWTMGGLEWLQLSSRLGMIALSAFMTHRLAVSERSAHQGALAQRKRFEEHLRRVREDDLPVKEGPVPLLARGIHDVNTALTIIMGSTQIVMSQAGENWFGREDLSRIESAVRLSKILLQNLYLVSSAGSWEAENVSVHALLEEALSQCGGEIRAKRLSVCKEFRAEADGAFLNPHLLQQALINLLFSAVHSTPPEKIIRISTGLADGPSRGVRVVIEDGGAPVPPQHAGRFFDPGLLIPGRGKGIGLGLFLSREIVLRHGGRVDLLPAGESGNRVALYLPDEGAESQAAVHLRDVGNHAN